MDNWTTRLLTPKRERAPLSPEQAFTLLSDPRLRAEDDPYLQNLVYLCERTGRDEYFRRLESRVRWKLLDFLRNPDAFIANLPRRGTLGGLSAGRAPILRLSSRDVLSLALGANGTSLNVLITGRTGSGKSSLTRVACLAYSGRAIIILFDRKGDLKRLAAYDQPGEVVTLEAGKDVQLSLSDGLGIMGPEEHISQMAGLLTEHLHLRSARRLLTALMHEAYRAEGPSGHVLSRLIHRLESIEAARTSQLGGYRDQLLFALRDLRARSGGIFDHAESNFLARLLARPRTFVIDTGNLAPDHMSLLGSFIYRYIFESRRLKRISEPPVIIGVDDAMALVTGTTSSEAEGHARPIATWSTLGRGFGIGLWVAAHSFSQVSPLLRQNTDNIVTLGSFGSDATAVARHMGLTSEQTAVIPRLRPGMGIALIRSAWPLPLLGAVPELIQ